MGPPQRQAEQGQPARDQEQSPDGRHGSDPAPARKNQRVERSREEQYPQAEEPGREANTAFGGNLEEPQRQQHDAVEQVVVRPRIPGRQQLGSNLLPQSMGAERPSDHGQGPGPRRHANP